MGIYIKGMEMPESGTYEVSIDNTKGKDKTVMSLFVLGEGGLICCGVYELVPVPPHGRLGDLDELHKEAVRRSEKAGTYDSWYNCTDRVIGAFDIENTPTIIQAEEGET